VVVVSAVAGTVAVVEDVLVVEAGTAAPIPKVDDVVDARSRRGPGVGPEEGGGGCCGPEEEEVGGAAALNSRFWRPLVAPPPRLLLLLAFGLDFLKSTTCFSGIAFPSFTVPYDDEK
jgi:hypothetical protein